MKVHFIASKSNIKNDIKNYRSIIDIVHELGHEVVHNWIDEAYDTENHLSHSDTNYNWREINEKNVSALSSADVVIADASTKSFSIGFQTAMAINQRKPVLVLINENITDLDTFGAKVTSNFITYERYNKDTIKSVIEYFLVDNTLTQKDLRFNFFIDRGIYNYLRWTADKTGKTKAEILRGILKREMDRSGQDKSE